MSGRDGLFRHGVASGDPLHDRVIIWTRVSVASDEPVEVEWLVAADPDLRDVVSTGSAVAAPDGDHTVKVDAEGLPSGSDLFYAFEVEGSRSPVGRTRTLPAGECESVRLAVWSCAKYSAGYFNALGRIADRDDLDFVLCLGDYIYEYSNEDRGLGPRIGRGFEPPHRCATLADYRTRYALHRRDPDVRRLHQRHALIAIPDDHEFADDTWRGGAEHHDPRTEGSWKERKATAFRAWHEWLPVRVSPEDPTRIYRRFQLGDLADLILLDTRTRRDRQAHPPEADEEERTLLGPEQFEWLRDQLSSSTARWRLVGNAVMIGQVKSDLMPEDIGDPLSELGVLTKREHGPEPDQWDGYPAERDRLLAYIQDAGIRDVVFLSGDVHSSWALELKRDPHQPAEESLAVEFCTTSVTSENLDEHAGWHPRTQSLEIEREIVDDNPHIYWAELDSHGYMLVDVSRERVQTDWCYVDEIHIPSDGEVVGASWEVRQGEPRLHDAPQAVAPRGPTKSDG